MAAIEECRTAALGGHVEGRDGCDHSGAGMRAGDGSLHTAIVFDLRRICRGAERAVYNPFLSSMLLAIESQRVIELRLVRLAWGGRAGWAEAFSMVVEKVHAAGEAMITLMRGGSPETVIARYREHVAFNAKRLTTA